MSQTDQPYAVPSPYGPGAGPDAAPPPTPPTYAGPPAYGPPGYAQPAYAPPPGGGPWAAPAAAPASTSKAPTVMAIIALIASGAALLLAFVVAVMTWWGGPVVDDGFAADEFTDPRAVYIQAQVRVTDGVVAGSLMQTALTRQIDLQNGFVDEMECPDTTDVHQGSVTVCHGSVDGYDDWTGIVIFEDADGNYFLDEH